MYYFQKTSNFNFESKDIDIKFSHKINKISHYLLDFFIENIDLDSEYSSFPINILNKSKFKDFNLDKYLDILLKIKISCEFKDSSNINNISSKFSFNIFDFIGVENNNIIYSFSSPVKFSFKEKNIFNKLGIFNRLYFKYEPSNEIFNILLKQSKPKGMISITLDELKNILNIPIDKYPRFYDFDSNILNKIIKDFENTYISIWFEKVKASESKKSKIVGVNIHYTNLYFTKLHKNTTNLLKQYVDFVEDFNYSYNFISDYLKKFGLGETIKYLDTNPTIAFKED